MKTTSYKHYPFIRETFPGKKLLPLKHIKFVFRFKKTVACYENDYQNISL